MNAHTELSWAGHGMPMIRVLCKALNYNSLSKMNAFRIVTPLYTSLQSLTVPLNSYVDDDHHWRYQENRQHDLQCKICGRYIAPDGYWYHEYSCGHVVCYKCTSKLSIRQTQYCPCCHTGHLIEIDSASEYNLRQIL